MSTSPAVDLAEYRSAFIIKPSSLGDVVHTLPAVHALKDGFPNLKLRWLVNTEWTTLLEGNADLDEVIPFPRDRFRGLEAAPAIFKWVRELNRAPRELPEIALDFQGLARSALLALARGAEPIMGMSDAREGASHIYRHVVQVNTKAHSVERYMAIPNALGAKSVNDGFVFPLPEGVMPAQVKLQSPFFVIHPYARGRGKSMEGEAIQALCACVAPRQTVVVGRTRNPHPVSGMNVVDLVNQTSLLELLWLLRHARGVISVDSGPMHIAAAVQDRTLGIHTWSDPRKVGPFNPKAVVWKAGRVANRLDFSDDELATEKPFTASDARRLADFLLLNWCGENS